jgi:glycolate dehydrogenase FAD-binding subunit
MAADPVLKALAAGCPTARGAAAGDAVAGVTPRYAASPVSTEEASALLRAAAAHDLAVVVRGSGSKLGWGAPPSRCDLVVDTLRLNQVLQHADGDLVVWVQAGVSVRHLANVLAASGQQLALDVPPGRAGEGPGAAGEGPGAEGDHTGPASQDGSITASGTVGGTLATGVAGPRRLRYGTPRDLVIGVTVVRADGTIARSGGKVVKNVAGYDLGKLFAGSYGTLGLITEAVFRLHPLPAGTAYVTAEYLDAESTCEGVAAAAGSELAPSAVEISHPCRASPFRAGVLLEGDPQGVAERAELMRGLLGPGAVIHDGAPPWWGWPGQPGTLVRIAFWAAGLPHVLTAVEAAAAAAGLDPAVTGSAAAGVIYASLGTEFGPAAVAAFVTGLRSAFAHGEDGGRPASAPVPDGPPALASAVVLYAPPAVAEQVGLWGPVPSLGLMRAVKDQFDPGHRMAPGRFAGGI